MRFETTDCTKNFEGYKFILIQDKDFTYFKPRCMNTLIIINGKIQRKKIPHFKERDQKDQALRPGLCLVFHMIVDLSKEGLVFSIGIII